MAELALGHTDTERDELEVPRPATQIVAVGSRRGEARDEHGVESFHNWRNDADLRRDRQMKCRSAEWIRHAELIVLLGELPARSQPGVETPSQSRARIIATDPHDRAQQQLATLLTGHRAARECRRSTRLIEEVLETETHTDRRLRF